MDAVEGRLGNMVSERRRLEQKLEEHRREEKEYMERMQEDQHALEKMQTKQSQLLKKVRGHSLRSNSVQNSRVVFCLLALFPARSLHHDSLAFLFVER